MLGDEPTAEAINRRLQTCLELGITTIDTAEIYGVDEVERRRPGAGPFAGPAR